MIKEYKNYGLFFKLIESFNPVGFRGIDTEDPLILELEKMMEKNNQFFHIADLLQIKILFTSKRSLQMIGIEPETMSPYHLLEATHLDDYHRYNLNTAKMFKMAHDFYFKGKGFGLLSTRLRIRNPQGEYSNVLLQKYIYYSSVPCKTVFLLEVKTNIDSFKKIKHDYNYYVGNDLSYFRYPYDEMLMKGNIFSDREFDIIKLIKLGYTSERIAEKLFLSVFTINTHRRNILEKSGKNHLSDVIFNLEERGLL
jgi:hypothetical protein